MCKEGCSLEPSEVSLKNFNDFIFISTLEGGKSEGKISHGDGIGGTKIHGGYVGATQASFIVEDFPDVHCFFLK